MFRISQCTFTLVNPHTGRAVGTMSRKDPMLPVMQRAGWIVW